MSERKYVPDWSIVEQDERVKDLPSEYKAKLFTGWKESVGESLDLSDKTSEQMAAYTGMMDIRERNLNSEEPADIQDVVQSRYKVANDRISTINNTDKSLVRFLADDLTDRPRDEHLDWLETSGLTRPGTSFQWNTRNIAPKNAAAYSEVNPTLALSKYPEYRDKIQASDLSQNDKIDALANYGIYRAHALGDSASYTNGRPTSFRLPEALTSEDHEADAEKARSVPLVGKMGSELVSDLLNPDKVRRVGSVQAFFLRKDGDRFFPENGEDKEMLLSETSLFTNPARLRDYRDNGFKDEGKVVSEYAEHYLRKRGMGDVADRIIEDPKGPEAKDMLDALKDSMLGLKDTWKRETNFKRDSDNKIVLNPYVKSHSTPEEIEKFLTAEGASKAEISAHLSDAEATKDREADAIEQGLLAGVTDRSEMGFLGQATEEVMSRHTVHYSRFFDASKDTLKTPRERIEAYRKSAVDPESFLALADKVRYTQTPLGGLGAVIQSMGSSDDKDLNFVGEMTNFLSNEVAGFLATGDRALGKFLPNLGIQIAELATGAEPVTEVRRIIAENRAGADMLHATAKSAPFGRMMAEEVAMMGLTLGSSVIAKPISKALGSTMKNAALRAGTSQLVGKEFTKTALSSSMAKRGKTAIAALSESFAGGTYFALQSSRSATASYGQAFDAYEAEAIANGMTPERAEEQARDRAIVPAMVSGVITGALMRAMPGGTEKAIKIFSKGGQRLSANAAKREIGLTATAIKTALKDKTFRKEFYKVATKWGLPSVLREGGKEAAEEFIDELGQGIVASMSYDPDRPILDIVKEAGIAAAMGGFMGGTMGGLASAGTKAPEKMTPELMGHIKNLRKQAQDIAGVTPETAKAVADVADKLETQNTETSTIDNGDEVFFADDEGTILSGSLDGENIVVQPEVDGGDPYHVVRSSVEALGKTAEEVADQLAQTQAVISEPSGELDTRLSNFETPFADVVGNADVDDPSAALTSKLSTRDGRHDYFNKQFQSEGDADLLKSASDLSMSAVSALTKSFSDNGETELATDLSEEVVNHQELIAKFAGNNDPASVARELKEFYDSIASQFETHFEDKQGELSGILDSTGLAERFDGKLAESKLPTFDLSKSDDGNSLHNLPSDFTPEQDAELTPEEDAEYQLASEVYADLFAANPDRAITKPEFFVAANDAQVSSAIIANKVFNDFTAGKADLALDGELKPSSVTLSDIANDGISKGDDLTEDQQEQLGREAEEEALAAYREGSVTLDNAIKEIGGLISPKLAETYGKEFQQFLSEGNNKKSTKGFNRFTAKGLQYDQALEPLRALGFQFENAGELLEALHRVADGEDVRGYPPLVQANGDIFSKATSKKAKSKKAKSKKAKSKKAKSKKPDLLNTPGLGTVLDTFVAGIGANPADLKIKDADTVPGKGALFQSKRIELDAEYLDAVESGDLEKAQEMVDFEANKKGFNDNYTRPGVIILKKGNSNLTGIKDQMLTELGIETDSDIDDEIETESGITVGLKVSNGGIRITSLENPYDKGKGLASKVVREITRMADDFGVRLTGTAEEFGSGGISTPSLLKWYSRNGFKITNDTHIVREPQGHNLVGFTKKVYRGYDSKQNVYATNLTTPVFTDSEIVANAYSSSSNNGSLFAGFVKFKRPIKLGDNEGAITLGELINITGEDIAKKIASSGLWMKDGDEVDFSEADNESYTDAYYIGDNADFTEWAKSQGYDGIVMRGMFTSGDVTDLVGGEVGSFDGDTANEYRPFNQNQIKSADPVTRDESGNVIPLSQRFDESKDSILYQSEADASKPEEIRTADDLVPILEENPSPQGVGVFTNTSNDAYALATGLSKQGNPVAVIDTRANPDIHAKFDAGSEGSFFARNFKDLYVVPQPEGVSSEIVGDLQQRFNYVVIIEDPKGKPSLFSRVFRRVYQNASTPVSTPRELSAGSLFLPEIRNFVKQNETVKDLLKTVAKDPKLGPLAKRLLSNLDSKPLGEKIIWLEPGERSYLSSAEKAIHIPVFLDKKSNLAFSNESFVHELMHALTLDGLKEAFGTVPNDGDWQAHMEKIAKQKSPIGEMARIYLAARKANPEVKGYANVHTSDDAVSSVFSKQKSEVSKVVTYGLSNIDEFISMAFESEEFREHLKGLKDPGRKTLFNSFVNAIKRLLKVQSSPTSLLSSIISESTDTFIDRPAGSPANDSGGNLYALASPALNQARQDVISKRVEVALTEIRRDINRGIIPEGVSSFAELHDYVDANMYINDADRDDNLIGDLGKANGFTGEDYVQISNEIIEGIDKELSPNPTQDAEYLAAVESGDISKAQEMVYERAGVAGYDVGPVYHGTPTGGFDKFSKNFQGRSGGRARGGFSFTSNKEAAKSYAMGFTDEAVALDEGIIIANEALRKTDNDQGVIDYFDGQGHDGVPEFSWQAVDDNEEFSDNLRSMARDLRGVNDELSAALNVAATTIESFESNPEVKTVFLKVNASESKTINSTSDNLGNDAAGIDVRNEENRSAIVNLTDVGDTIYYVADSNQIKSADPVTRDSSGNVIPLSQRFDESQDSILYQSEDDASARPSISPSGFFSGVEAALLSPKAPAKGTPASFMNWLVKQPGVKKNELQWLGINEWLTGKKSVTKKEVLEFVRENGVEVEEESISQGAQVDVEAAKRKLEEIAEESRDFYRDKVEIRIVDEDGEFVDTVESEDHGYQLGDDFEKYEVTLTDESSESFDSFGEAKQRFDDEMDWVEDDSFPSDGESVVDFEGNTVAEFNGKDIVNDAGDVIESFSNEEDDTEYSEYRHDKENGENYREILLKLPVEMEEPTHETVAQELFSTTYGNAPAGTVKTIQDELQKRKDIYYGAKRPYTSGHFSDHENIAVWTRVDDRKDSEGNKVLFVQEIQSDWNGDLRKSGARDESELARLQKDLDDARLAHTENFEELNAGEFRVRGLGERTEYLYAPSGLEYGYGDPWKSIAIETAPREIQMLWITRGRLKDKINDLTTKLKGAQNAVPDMPFKDTYYELALKKLLKIATEEGYDKVAWTTGAQQIEVYTDMLRMNVNSLEWSRSNDSILKITMPEHDSGWQVQFDKSGKGIAGDTESIPIEGKTLEEVVGKTIATQIRESSETSGTIEGDNLSIGGHFHKMLYDTAVPSYLKKFTKKWGGKVETSEINGTTQQSLEVTPKMRESVQSEGVPLFGITRRDVIKGLTAGATAAATQSKGNDTPISRAKAHINPYVRLLDDMGVTVEISGENGIPQYNDRPDAYFDPNNNTIFIDPAKVPDQLLPLAVYEEVHHAVVWNSFFNAFGKDAPAKMINIWDEFQAENPELSKDLIQVYANNTQSEFPGYNKLVEATRMIAQILEAGTTTELEALSTDEALSNHFQAAIKLAEESPNITWSKKAIGILRQFRDYLLKAIGKETNTTARKKLKAIAEHASEIIKRGEYQAKGFADNSKAQGLERTAMSAMKQEPVINKAVVAFRRSKKKMGDVAVRGSQKEMKAAAYAAIDASRNDGTLTGDLADNHIAVLARVNAALNEWVENKQKTGTLKTDETNTGTDSEETKLPTDDPSITGASGIEVSGDQRETPGDEQGGSVRDPSGLDAQGRTLTGRKDGDTQKTARPTQPSVKKRRKSKGEIAQDRKDYREKANKAWAARRSNPNNKSKRIEAIENIDDAVKWLETRYVDLLNKGVDGLPDDANNVVRALSKMVTDNYAKGFKANLGRTNLTDESKIVYLAEINELRNETEEHISAYQEMLDEQKFPEDTPQETKDLISSVIATVDNARRSWRASDLEVVRSFRRASDLEVERSQRSGDAKVGRSWRAGDVELAPELEIIKGTIDLQAEITQSIKDGDEVALEEQLEELADIVPDAGPVETAVLENREPVSEPFLGLTWTPNKKAKLRGVHAAESLFSKRNTPANRSENRFFNAMFRAETGKSDAYVFRKNLARELGLSAEFEADATTATRLTPLSRKPISKVTKDPSLQSIVRQAKKKGITSKQIKEKANKLLPVSHREMQSGTLELREMPTTRMNLLRSSTLASIELSTGKPRIENLDAKQSEIQTLLKQSEGSSDILLQDVETIKQLRQGSSDGTIKGYYDPETDIIGLLKEADASTVLHEVAHWARRQMIGTPHGDAFNKYYGEKDNNWSRESEEAFARHFERYMRDGRPPKGSSLKLKRAFRTIRDLMRDIYDRLTRNSPLWGGLPVEVRAEFDKIMLAGDQTMTSMSQSGREMGGNRLLKSKVEPVAETSMSAKKTPAKPGEFQSKKFKPTSAASRLSQYNDVFEGYEANEAELLSESDRFEIASDNIKKTFGIAVTKSPDLEIQDAVNQLMDARAGLQNMAAAMGLPGTSMSLFGKLTLHLGRDTSLSGVFGSYSRGNEQVRTNDRNNVFAHEWAHALDFELLDNATFLDDANASGATGDRRSGGAKGIFEGRLDGSFSTLMRAIFQDDAATAQRLRGLELQLEKADPSKKDVLQSQIDNIKGAVSDSDENKSSYQTEADLEEGEYWKTPTEMFARAFEAFIAHEIEMSKGDTVFAVNPSESFDELYPKGSEQEVIFDAFRELFQKLAIEQSYQGPKADVFKSLSPVNPLNWAAGDRNVKKGIAKIINDEWEAWTKELATERRRKKDAGESGNLKDFNTTRRGLFYSMRAELLTIEREYKGDNAAQKIIKGKLANVPGGKKLSAENKGNPAAVRAIRAIRKTIANVPGDTELSAESYSETVERKSNEKKNKVYESAKSRGLDPNKMTDEDERTITDLLTNTKSTLARNATNAHKGTAAALRELTRKEFQENRDVDIELGYVENGYLPRIYDQAKAQARASEFIAAAKELYTLMREQAIAKLDPVSDAKEIEELHNEDLDGKAAAWHKRLVYGDDDSAFDKHGAEVNYTKSRELPAEADQIMREFLMKSPIDAIMSYMEASTRRVAYVKLFGVKGEKLAAMKTAMQDAGMHSRDVDAVETIVDKATGRNGRRLDTAMQNVASTIHTIGTINLLPRAVYASIAEPLTIASRSGKPLDILMSIYYTVKGFKSSEMAELSSFLGAVGSVGYDSTMANRTGGGATKGAHNRILNRFFERTLLAPLTRGQRRSAVVCGIGYLKHLASRLKKGGKHAEQAKQEFRELGISDYDGFSSFVTDLEKIPSIDALEGSPYQEQLAIAVNRFVNQSIQDPSPVDKPRFATDPVGSVIYNITAFAYTFYENAMKGTARRMKNSKTPYYTAAGVLPAMASLYLAQTLVSVIRYAITNGEMWDEEEGENFVEKAMTPKTFLRGISRTYPLPSVDPLVNAVSGLKYNRTLDSLASGAYNGYIFGALEKMAKFAVGDKSETSNFASRNAAKGLYELVATPMINWSASAAPGGPILRPVYGIAMQKLTSQTTKSAFADKLVGKKYSFSAAALTKLEDAGYGAKEIANDPDFKSTGAKNRILKSDVETWLSKR